MKNIAYVFCICSHEGKCHKRRFSNEESGLLFLKMVSDETEYLHFEYDVRIAKIVGNIISSSSEAQCLDFLVALMKENAYIEVDSLMKNSANRFGLCSHEGIAAGGMPK